MQLAAFNILIKNLKILLEMPFFLMSTILLGNCKNNTKDSKIYFTEDLIEVSS